METVISCSFVEKTILKFIDLFSFIRRFHVMGMVANRVEQSKNEHSAK